MHTYLEVFSSYTNFSAFYSSSKYWALQSGRMDQFQQNNTDESCYPVFARVEIKYEYSYNTLNPILQMQK